MARKPLIEVLIDFGHPRGITPSQVELAWLLAKKPWIVPIPGTTKQAHLFENLMSADLQFTEAEVSELDSAVSKITIYGDRYTAWSKIGYKTILHAVLRGVNHS